MREFVISVVLLLLAFAAMLAPSFAETPQRGLVAVKIDDEAGKTRSVPLYQRSFALVIGIDRYSDPAWPSLSNAIADANAVAGELTRQGFEVTFRSDLKSADLKRAIEDFVYEKGRHEDARLLIWYAGHGHTLGDEGYLAPADAPTPDKDDWKFRRDALSLREFGRYMREARAKHVLAVFDSCFAGTVFKTARARPPAVISRVTTQKVRQFVSSGEASQQVSDDGLFRKLFLDAITGRDPRADMNGDGYVIGSELGLYLEQQVSDKTDNRQTPRYGKLNDYGYDLGDFVFATTAAPSPHPGPPRQGEGGIGGAEAGGQTGSDGSGWGATVKNWLGGGTAGGQTGAAPNSPPPGGEGSGVGGAASAELAALKAKMAALEAALQKQKEAPAPAKPADGENKVAVGVFPPSSNSVAVGHKELTPGDTFDDCGGAGWCPKMVVVPAGSFMMGSPASEEGRGDDEGPQRKVTIAKPFAVGKFEVTWDEWEACVEAKGCDGKGVNEAGGDEGWGKGKRPVINVSWDDAKAYVNWLAKKTGESYRLLSEAEWEYVARAGNRTKYTFGDQEKRLCEYGNVADKTAKKTNKDWTIAPCDDGFLNTSEVGQFKANDFGLHDVHGNVWEWVEDCYQDNYKGAPNDGSAVTTGSCNYRVLRGGSWFNGPRFLRSASRDRYAPDFRYVNHGFRVARALSLPGRDSVP